VIRFRVSAVRLLLLHVCLQLADKVQSLQQQLAKLEAAAAAAAPVVSGASSLHSKPPQPSMYSGDGVTYDARGWYLHACVALAALAVRWWLLHQADPLQRKVMLVVIWPVSCAAGRQQQRALWRGIWVGCVQRRCCVWALLVMAHSRASFSSSFDGKWYDAAFFWRESW
jgi:hypothetical protein